MTKMSKWVKVSKRKPEATGCYAIYSQAIGKVVWGFWDDAVKLWHGDRDNVIITHWRPLPKPPKD
jgi:hypothetical protein